MVYDCTIIGGGPAGLNAALVLGRARKNVMVIDEGRPRNRVTHEIHGFLTRDKTAPSEFRRIAREQIGAYPSVAFEADAAVSITGTDGDFVVTMGRGKVVRSRKVLFAVGKKDLPLAIPGLADVYGTSAFVCPYCDGWEMRDRQLALVVNGAKAMHIARLIAGWTNRYSVCTNGPAELTPDEQEELRQHGVPVYEAPIRAIVSNDGMVQLIELEDGTSVPCTGIFFGPKLAAGSDLPQAIGCEMTEAGSVVVDAMGKTIVPGIFSAGDAATEMHQAISAAALGAIAAAGINHELAMENWNSIRTMGAVNE